MDFAKVLRSSFYTDHPWWLLLAKLSTRLNPFKAKYFHHKETIRLFSQRISLFKSKWWFKIPLSLSIAFSLPTSCLMMIQNFFVLLLIWSLVFYARIHIMHWSIYIRYMNIEHCTNWYFDLFRQSSSIWIEMLSNRAVALYTRYHPIYFENLFHVFQHKAPQPYEKFVLWQIYH